MVIAPLFGWLSQEQYYTVYTQGRLPAPQSVDAEQILVYYNDDNEIQGPL